MNQKAAKIELLAPIKSLALNDITSRRTVSSLHSQSYAMKKGLKKVQNTLLRQTDSSASAVSTSTINRSSNLTPNETSINSGSNLRKTKTSYMQNNDALNESGNFGQMLMDESFYGRVGMQ